MKSFVDIFRWFILSLLTCNFLESSGKIITIESGALTGEDLGYFHAFRSIPYAEPPVGDLRLAPPKIFSQKWDGVRKFKDFGPECAQLNHFGYQYDGNEDCLTLSVYVPEVVLKSEVKVPVIFFIHGGAFMFGSGMFYDPENIMKEGNLILVTINYRLGVLGFLSTEDEVIPGNFGLKDQVAALQWVQRNIAAFNGDSSRVTVVGYSAGGASVHLHYMSPMSKGLFNNGISHSGVANNPWVMMERARDKSHALAATVGCPEDDHKELLKCLRQKPAEKLVMFAKTLQPFLYNPFSPFGVVVEKSHEGAFLTSHPLEILKSGSFEKKPWLLSQTEDEGLYPGAEFYDDEILKEINDRFDELAPHLLDFDGISDDFSKKLDVSRKIRRRYLGDEKIEKKSFKKFINIISDYLFSHGAHKAIQLQSQFSQSYFYYFRYKSHSGLAEYMSKSQDNLGISHGEDVLLIFSHDLRNTSYTEEEQMVQRNLIKMYHDFSMGRELFFGKTKISPCENGLVRFLEISTHTESKMTNVDDEFGEMKFWDEIEQNLKEFETNIKNEL